MNNTQKKAIAKNEIIDVRIREDTGYKNLPRSTVVVDVVINGVCHRLETEFNGEMVREEDDPVELGKSRQDIAFYQNGCLFQDGYTSANPGTYELEKNKTKGKWSNIVRHEKRFREIEYNNDGKRID